MAITIKQIEESMQKKSNFEKTYDMTLEFLEDKFEAYKEKPTPKLKSELSKVYHLAIFLSEFAKSGFQNHLGRLYVHGHDDEGFESTIPERTQNFNSRYVEPVDNIAKRLVNETSLHLPWYISTGVNATYDSVLQAYSNLEFNE